MFGYDTGVISSALLFITSQFHLSSFAQQAVVASLLLGAVCGALIGGTLSDRLGRKRTLLAAAAVFALGALGSAAAPTAVLLVVSPAEGGDHGNASEVALDVAVVGGVAGAPIGSRLCAQR